MPPSPELTQLLNAAAAGDEFASEQLFSEIYAQLKAMALGHVRREYGPDPLQPTALVSEAYLRLFGRGSEQWPSRSKFFLAAGEAMRRILVEQARTRHTQKRGGDCERVEVDPGQLLGQESDADLLVLDEALTHLKLHNPRMAQVVDLRFFAGLNMAEVAKALEVSLRTVEADWARARAWLTAALNESGDDSSGSRS